MGNTLKSKFGLLITAAVFLLYSGCQDQSVKTELGLNEKLNFSAAEYKKQLTDVLSSQNSTLAIKNSKLQYFDTLRIFYSERNFEPRFIQSFDRKLFIDSLLDLFSSADEHGLNPERYHVSQISKEFSEAVKDSSESRQRYKHLTNAELLVSDAVMKYAYHMRYGVINPNKILLDTYFIPLPDSSKRDLFLPMKKGDVVNFLAELQPKSKKYLQLQKALKQVNSYKTVNWLKISPPSKKLKVGDRDTCIYQINQQLLALGLIDSSKIGLNDFSIYDSLFENNLKTFQGANGLVADGVLSKSTIEKLNITPNEYKNKIIASLERFRWFDYSDTSKYVLVNIPDFRLYVVENGEEKFDITVCAGRKRYANFEKLFLAYQKNKSWQNKPEDWETPILYSRISHLILNPTWTVPFSIMREEIAGKVRRDSAYLKKANFRVYRNGKSIDPSEVKVKELSSGSVPYTIIQNPGAGNALGKIKFMFDNPFGVYLHDTPTRAPFGFSNRAVSHGCVRVEKPLKLAEYILEDNSKWTLDFLKIEIGSKVDNKESIEEFKKIRSELRKNSSLGITTEVKLDKQIPLFIDYYTAWVDKHGVLNFRDDVYNQDKIILDHLNNIQ